MAGIRSFGPMLSFVCASTLTLFAARAAAQVSFRPVAGVGDHAAGTGEGVFKGFESPTISQAGDVVFTGFLEPNSGDVTPTNDDGVWRSGATGRPELIVRRGDPAPGTSGGVFAGFDIGTFSHDIRPLFNDAGQVALITDIESGEYGIWVPGAGDELKLLALEGRQAPGTGGMLFDEFGYTGAWMSPNGGVAFIGSAYADVPGGGLLEGVWGPDPSGQLSLILKSGSPAPGSGDAEYGGFRSMSYNVVGQIAVVGLLDQQTTGVLAENNLGVWGPGSNGLFGLLAREGSAAPGTSGGVYGDAFGGPWLNDAGEVAFMGSIRGAGSKEQKGAWVTDGSGGIRRIGSDGSGNQIIQGDILDLDLNDHGRLAFVANDPVNPGIWIDDPLEGLRLILGTHEAAPGTNGARFGQFGRFWQNNMGDLVLEAYLQTGEGGVTTDNNSGIWAYSERLDKWTLIVREGQWIDLDHGPGTDLHLVTGAFASGASVDRDRRRTYFNDRGELVLLMWFEDGTGGVFVATVPEPSLGAIAGVVVTAFVFLRPRHAGRIHRG